MPLVKIPLFNIQGKQTKQAVRAARPARAKSCCLLDMGVPTRQLLLHTGAIDTTALTCDVTGLDEFQAIVPLHESRPPLSFAGRTAAATTTCNATSRPGTMGWGGDNNMLEVQH